MGRNIILFSCAFIFLLIPFVNGASISADAKTAGYHEVLYAITVQSADGLGSVTFLSNIYSTYNELALGYNPVSKIAAINLSSDASGNGRLTVQSGKLLTLTGDVHVSGPTTLEGNLFVNQVSPRSGNFVIKLN